MHKNSLNIQDLIDQRQLGATVFPETQKRMKLIGHDGTGAEIDFNYQVRRFKCKNGCEHYNHLVCLLCGGSTYVDNRELEDFQDQMAKVHGFKPKRCTFQIYGFCKNCQSS